MAAPTGVTNSFTADTAAQASQINTNFTDILNWVTDTTKDLSFGACTLSGTLTANGNVVLGNAVTDTVTITGQIAADIDPNAASTIALGSSTLPFQQLNIDNGATDSGAVYFDAGTTEYIKGNAGGTILAIGGFTELDGEDLVKFDMGGANLAKTSAPDADNLYPNSMCKAWALLTLGVAGAVTVTAGFNIDTASYSGTDLTVNFHTNLANANYAVLISADNASDPGVNDVSIAWASSKAVGTMVFIHQNNAGAQKNWASGHIVQVVVFGEQ